MDIDPSVLTALAVVGAATGVPGWRTELPASRTGCFGPYALELALLAAGEVALESELSVS